MKKLSFSRTALLSGALFLSQFSVAQNVGIGTSIPLDKLHVVGNIRSTTLAGVGNRIVLADPNGTLIVGGAGTSPAWMVTGNSGLNGGNTTTAGVNFLGTTDAQNVDFRTNNIVRGRFSSLGEFFVGTLNTVIAGDLMNAVGNTTFYWAVNGYSPAGVNGGAVYGMIQPGNSTIFGGVQGEYYGSNPGGAGVRGISALAGGTGVSGSEPSLVGWAFLSQGDYGAAAGGNYWIASDERLKKNIHPITNSLNKIMAMKTYSFEYDIENHSKYFKATRTNLGFLAQELEQVLPEAVASKTIGSLNVDRANPDKSSETMQMKAVNMNAVVPVLVNAIQEQQQIINELRSRIAVLENGSKK